MANNPNEISPEEGEAIKRYIEKNGLMSGCKNLFTSESALPISDVVKSDCIHDYQNRQHTRETCKYCGKPIWE